MLAYPAPRRCSHELPFGKFFTTAWTADEVTRYRAAGGWFQQGNHDFKDDAARKAAFQ